MALKGINLGGWLVLEKWLTPSLFEGTDAVDEFNLSKLTSIKKDNIIRQHHETWILNKDFAWIKKLGLSSVRIPVGYWIFGDQPPYTGGIDILDKAFEWAEHYDLKIIIDLHAAPGSQNGHDHSGKSGKVLWHTNRENTDLTTEVLKRLANRYRLSKAFWGIELLNEPSVDIPLRYREQFYEDAYWAIRSTAGSNVKVVFNDSFQPYVTRWLLNGPQFENVAIDCHLFQVFGKADNSLSYQEHLDKASQEWHKLIGGVKKNLPVIIGEWSAALPVDILPSDTHLKDDAYRRYYEAQMKTFESADAWYYFTYKSESPGPWNFRQSVESGIISL